MRSNFDVDCPSVSQQTPKRDPRFRDEVLTLQRDTKPHNASRLTVFGHLRIWLVLGKLQGRIGQFGFRWTKHGHGRPDLACCGQI